MQQQRIYNQQQKAHQQQAHATVASHVEDPRTKFDTAAYHFLPTRIADSNTFGFRPGANQSQEQIRHERNRLLKEKDQWLSHVKKENDVLMSLLSDVRVGKDKVRAEKALSQDIDVHCQFS